MDINKNLRQEATWWAVSPNGFGGDTFAAPVKIKCRWEDRQELVPDMEGTTSFISNAMVFVDRDIPIGSVLILGDSSGVADPTTLKGSFKVRRMDKVTDLRSANTVRRVTL